MSIGICAFFAVRNRDKKTAAARTGRRRIEKKSKLRRFGKDQMVGTVFIFMWLLLKSAVRAM